MFDFLVNAEGGLTAAGYGVCIAAGIVLFITALIFAGRVSEKKRMGTKQLVFCAMALALAFITSYIKLFNMPWGGSVTLCSMLWAEDRYSCGSGIRNPAVYSGTVRAVFLPGMLRLYSCFCSAGSGRIFFEEKARADYRIYCGGNCKRSVSRSGRLSLLDGLHAGQFPPVSEKSVSDSV